MAASEVSIGDRERQRETEGNVLSLNARLLLATAMPLLNATELLLDIHGLHLLETRSVLRRIRLAVVRRRRLFPPRSFLLSYRHASGAIVYVVALAGEALEIVGDLGRIDDGGVSGFGLRPLFLPARVKKLD